MIFYVFMRNLIVDKGRISLYFFPLCSSMCPSLCMSFSLYMLFNNSDALLILYAIINVVKLDLERENNVISRKEKR